MASAVSDVEPSVFHMVDEPVFFVDAAAVFALQIAGEGFGFPDSLQASSDHIFSLIVHFDQFMDGAFPGFQLPDGFLYIGHVCLGEKWVGSLGDFKRDAVFA